MIENETPFSQQGGTFKFYVEQNVSSSSELISVGLTPITYCDIKRATNQINSCYNLEKERTTESAFKSDTLGQNREKRKKEREREKRGKSEEEKR